MSDNRIRIGISQGDTNGIGWETIVKALRSQTIGEICTPVVYGTPAAAKFYNIPYDEEEAVRFNVCPSAAQARRGAVNLVEVGDGNLAIEPGKSTDASAQAALDSLEKAVEDLKAGEISALVTAPISKEAMLRIGFQYTGHTEYLAAKFDGEAMMIMCSDTMRVALQTIHIPLDRVSESLSTESITSKLTALRKTLKQDFGVVEPRIAVLSLNPHTGDGGMLGTEEIDIIRPAVLAAVEQGVLAFGPLSADGIFAGGAYRKYDGVLAMYHDQGLAPFKALSPEGVNFTAGLSCVRTSPDHGTAFDIAGKGIADGQSMRSAIYTAIDIVRRREAYSRWSRNPLEHFERDKGKDLSISDLKIPEKEDI